LEIAARHVLEQNEHLVVSWCPKLSRKGLLEAIVVSSGKGGRTSWVSAQWPQASPNQRFSAPGE
jgi:hypothetical protein